MTEVQMDGGSADGTDTNANGVASGNQSVQQPSFDAAKLQSSIDALIGKVGELEARTNGLQSVKDKTTSEVSGLKARIAEYEQLKEKLGPDGAIDQMELRQTLAEIKAQLSGSVPAQPAGSGASETFNVAQAVEDLQVRQLDANDPDFIKLLKKGLSKETFNEYIANKTRPQPAATPSGMVQSPATGTPKASPEGLTAEYQTRMISLRGNKQAAMALKEEYRQKGVPVDQVYFGV